MSKNFKYSDITGAIIGSAMAVRSAFGNGFPEGIYQRSLAIDFKQKKLIIIANFQCLYTIVINPWAKEEVIF